MKSKKMFIIGVEAVIILCILISYYFIFIEDSWGEDNISYRKNLVSNSKTDELQEGLLKADIEADIIVQKNTVKIKQSIYLKRGSETAYLYLPSKNKAKTMIKNIEADKGFTNVIVSDSNIRIDFEEKQEKVYIEYEIYLNDAQETLSYNEDNIFLTNFLITPALYKDGEPILLYQSKFGDPYIYDINDYNIRLKLDKAFTAYAPGKMEEDIMGDDKITTFRGEDLRDFPIAIFKDAKVDIRKHGETDIYYIDSIDAEKYIEEAFEFANTHIGEYPYKEFFVVKAPLELRGMEFSNMIFLSESCFDSDQILKSVSYHEVFHQWFYGIIGTDQINEPFLDEGIVNYLALMLANNGVNKYFDPKLFDLRLRDYHSKDQYYDLAYNDAAVYFGKVHKDLGDNFYEMLRQIYREKKFSIIYFNEVLRYVEQYMGGN